MEISTKVNWLATIMFKIYVKLPVVLTLIGLYFNLDPLYYFARQMSISATTLVFLIRSIVLVASFTELSRMITLIICPGLLVINLGKRETHMWKIIAGRSSLGGLYFYREISILYKQRGKPAMCLVTLLVLLCLVLQVMFC